MQLLDLHFAQPTFEKQLLPLQLQLQLLLPLKPHYQQLLQLFSLPF